MNGGDGGFCAWTGSYFYGEYPPPNGIFRSPDGTFANIEYPPSPGDARNWASPLIVDPNNSNTLLFGGTRLWRCTNANANSHQDVAWTSISPQRLVGGVYDIISAIAVAPGFSNIIWVGYNSGEIYYTTNGTAASPTWTRIRQSVVPLPLRYCERIAFGRSPKVYVAFGGLNNDEGFNADNLWKTQDNGQTWTNISNGLPNAPIPAIVGSPRNSGYLYIGTAVGVFASTDDGSSWSSGISGDAPANVFVDELFWTNNGARLVAVTHGRGMFTANAQ
jgi:hypothetical protein